MPTIKVKTIFQKKCPNNSDVICDVRRDKCESCGWNPDVAEARKKKWYDEHKGLQIKRPE